MQQNINSHFLHKLLQIGPCLIELFDSKWSQEQVVLLWTFCCRSTCICKIHFTDFENWIISNYFSKQKSIRCSETKQMQEYRHATLSNVRIFIYSHAKSVMGMNVCHIQLVTRYYIIRNLLQSVFSVLQAFILYVGIFFHVVPYIMYDISPFISFINIWE